MKAQSTAKLKHLRMSPRKVRLLVDLIRGKKVEDAIAQLEHNTKHASVPVLKLLISAVANAKENHDIISDTLVVKTAFADESPTLHRWMPRAMGRASGVSKRGSHITIVLEGDVKESAKKIKKDKEKETEAKQPNEKVIKKSKKEEKK